MLFQEVGNELLIEDNLFPVCCFPLAKEFSKYTTRYNSEGFIVSNGEINYALCRLVGVQTDYDTAPKCGLATKLSVL